MLQSASGKDSWDGSILQGLEAGDAVYFVHSYTAFPTDNAHRLADCEYNGLQVSAAIQKNMLSGCQFHPEKSGEVGLAILKNFVNF